MHLEDEKGFDLKIGPIQGRHAQTMPTAGSTEYQIIASTAYPKTRSVWVVMDFDARAREPTCKVRGKNIAHGQ